jgi:hypothetical protein
MAKALLEKHARAIELRTRGWSYPAIKKALNVSKGSLSLWLHKYPLTEKQIRKLSPLSRERRIEHFRETFRKKREGVLVEAYNIEQVRIGELNKREIYLMGLMLYWGEGMKATRGTISFANTNPAMIRMAKYWLISCMGIVEAKLRVKLHLYSDMNIEAEIQYWVKEIGIPRTQFKKPYIKESKYGNLTQKGFGHGTCDLGTCDTKKKDLIIMALKVVSEYFS